jgi:pilus assembly protein CpaE
MRFLIQTRRKLRALQSDTDGASAVEFGMIAPFIFFALLAMVDLGQVAGERINMDHVVRAGAESAMVNADEDEILKVLESTAEQNFTLPSQTDQGNTYTAGATYPISLAANRLCECPEAPGTEADCSNACANDVPPNVYVDLTAAKQYSGMILPDFNLNTKARVQLR